METEQENTDRHINNITNPSPRLKKLKANKSARGPGAQDAIFEPKAWAF